MSNKLHDILTEFGLECSVDGVDKLMYLRAKQAIKDLFNELVGPNDINNGLAYEPQVVEESIRNALKAELRKKIEEL